MKHEIPYDEKRTVFRSKQDRVKPRSALRELADQMLKDDTITPSREQGD